VSVALPFWFATTTFTVAPGLPGGTLHTSEVSFSTCTPVAAAPPIVTTFTPAWSARNPVPVMATGVVALALPWLGATDAMVGRAW
jgi:hypothetical protein